MCSPTTNHWADCCILTNEYDDDFYSTNAAIEVVMRLIIGGKPLVGYTSPNGAKVQVLRDLPGITWW